MNRIPRALPIGIGLVMVAFGMSQISSPRSWYAYIPKWTDRFLPVGKDEFFLLHGGTNVVLGLALISGLAPRPASRLSLWWWLSVTPFAWLVDWRSGARDTAILASLLSYDALLHEDKRR